MWLHIHAGKLIDAITNTCWKLIGNILIMGFFVLFQYMSLNFVIDIEIQWMMCQIPQSLIKLISIFVIFIAHITI